MPNEEDLKILTFSDKLFKEMAEREESVAVFKAEGGKEVPVTLVLQDEEAFIRHQMLFPDAQKVGEASYHDIERGYPALDLIENNYCNYEQISKYIDEQNAKSSMLEKVPGLLGRLFGANAEMTEKPAKNNNSPSLALK